MRYHYEKSTIYYLYMELHILVIIPFMTNVPYFK